MICVLTHYLFKLVYFPLKKTIVAYKATGKELDHIKVNYKHDNSRRVKKIIHPEYYNKVNARWSIEIV